MKRDRQKEVFHAKTEQETGFRTFLEFRYKTVIKMTHESLNYQYMHAKINISPIIDTHTLQG